MIVSEATNQHEWDTFLSTQPYRPFLQSWTMGEVYDAVGQPPVRLITSGEHGEVLAICFGHIVPARRGRHLSIPYGPILASSLTREQKVQLLTQLIEVVKDAARSHNCAFIRMSPLWPASDQTVLPHSVQSPLHLLAEHVWYLPLQDPDLWSQSVHCPFVHCSARTEDSLLSAMRKTTRNLIRRAEHDGVTVTASLDPVSDLEHFLRLHEETRKRHGFTAYSGDFFRAQVERFSRRSECTLYFARYQGDVIAASIHMHAFGETSYHHGASSMSNAKIPAGYLLQWTAIRDALRRGDRIYNFWGIAPPSLTPIPNPNPHPFSGVTLFKTGFGGRLLNLVHCTDTPVRTIYWLTYGFEMLRKWRRGF